MTLEQQLKGLLKGSISLISDKLPSEWAEERMHIATGRFQGPLKYWRTPYFREIVDFFSPYNPYREGCLMGSAQLGKTKAIIEPAICYRISEYPCNIGYVTGQTDLSQESVDSLDLAIDHAGIGDLIRKQTMRKTNMKSGDTRKVKEYPGGKLIPASATNHNVFRQRDWQVVIPDDIEAAPLFGKKTGSTVELIRKRTDSFGDLVKIFWSSSPQTFHHIIYPLFITGDCRYWNIPCPKCQVVIDLRWDIDVNGEKAGIYWREDNHGNLKGDSVGYICQKCGKFFDDRNKTTFLNEGLWVPTATATNPYMTSWQLNCLYAAEGMNSWKDYVLKWIACHPQGQPVKQKELHSFYNLNLGLPYESSAVAIDSKKLQKNQRPYQPMEVPEKLSIADGNGRIVLITMAADMNGKVEDARMDWEIVAWAASGANYSISHGSIGTFIPREEGVKVKVDRKRLTYEFNKPNSVWAELDKLREHIFNTDSGRQLKIMYTFLDCGFFSANYAYPYVDLHKNVLGIKGKWQDTYLKFNQDVKYFYDSKERPGSLYLVTVGKIKDDIAEGIDLKWDERNDTCQPYGFMNYPKSKDGLYEYSSYFSHYESEHPIIEANEDGTAAMWKWVKKNSAVMNHFLDTRVYNMAGREIVLHLFHEMKKKEYPKMTWKIFADYWSGIIEDWEKRKTK